MNEFFLNSTYFGVVLSLLCYWGALKISAKVKSTLVNPLCLSSAFIIAILLIFKIDYETSMIHTLKSYYNLTLKG